MPDQKLSRRTWNLTTSYTRRAVMLGGEGSASELHGAAGPLPPERARTVIDGPFAGDERAHRRVLAVADRSLKEEAIEWRKRRPQPTCRASPRLRSGRYSKRRTSARELTLESARREERPRKQMARAAKRRRSGERCAAIDLVAVRVERARRVRSPATSYSTCACRADRSSRREVDGRAAVPPEIVQQSIAGSAEAAPPRPRRSRQARPEPRIGRRARLRRRRPAASAIERAERLQSRVDDRALARRRGSSRPATARRRLCCRSGAPASRAQRVRLDSRRVHEHARARLDLRADSWLSRSCCQPCPYLFPSRVVARGCPPLRLAVLVSRASAVFRRSRSPTRRSAGRAQMPRGALDTLRHPARNEVPAAQKRLPPPRGPQAGAPGRGAAADARRRRSPPARRAPRLAGPAPRRRCAAPRRHRRRASTPTSPPAPSPARRAEFRLRRRSRWRSATSRTPCRGDESLRLRRPSCAADADRPALDLRQRDAPDICAISRGSAARRRRRARHLPSASRLRSNASRSTTSAGVSRSTTDSRRAGRKRFANHAHPNPAALRDARQSEPPCPLAREPRARYAGPTSARRPQWPRRRRAGRTSHARSSAVCARSSFPREIA